MSANELVDKYRRQLKEALLASGADLQAEAKRELSKPGRGVFYDRKNMRNRSSKPGDPPAVQTGHGRRSVQVDNSRINQFEVRVGTNLKYMAHHETHGRPWLLPSLMRVKERIRARFAALRRR